ncbi:hypothetical protein HYW21_02845 [Candidatus Woesearchaeota archaeon]|nr:hypothetical protein [Candidatus Woesearchaeota archaeon]
MEKKEVLPTIQTHMHLIIGSDEALKGDTFGGIVVAAVMAGPEERKQLQELGVKDSKKISDLVVHRLAQVIKQKFQWSIRNVYPEEYNQRDGEVILTSLLNKLHRECADELRGKYTTKRGKIVHVVDQYPGCTVGDIIVTKAEEKYVEVAAASIIARDAALLQLQELTKLAGFPIPKGSTHVQEALEQAKKGTIPLHLLVKLHFRNVQGVMRKE